MPPRKPKAVSRSRSQPPSRAGGAAARPSPGDHIEPWWIGAVLRVILVLCVGLALRGVTGGWDKPLQDLHGFRQTQTALNVRSMIEDGAWLRYETPVFGPPWSIPFELPVYQWFVALFSIVTGMPLVTSGRTIGIAFFGASAVLAYRVLGQLGVKADHRLALLSLFLASPLYLFWSRTVLIESTALFFSLAYLSLVLRALERPSFGGLLTTAIVGALAATVKASTFWGFLFAATVLALRQVRKLQSDHRGWRFVRQQSFQMAAGALTLGAAVVPGLALLGWTRFTDSLKLANPLAAGFLDARALTFWNFGDVSQRISARFWRETLLGTQVPEVLGSSLFLPLLLIAACVPWPRRPWIWGAVAAFVLGPLTFTNLHIVHNYYAYANGVFLLAAAGFAVIAGLEHGRTAAPAALLALTVIVAAQQFEYERAKGYRMHQTNVGSQIPTLYERMRDLVPKDDVILVYGLDWDPSPAYYSEHRLIMDRANRPLHDPPISESLRLLEQDGRTIGAMVDCRMYWNAPGPYHPPDVDAVIRTFGLSIAPVFDDGKCTLYVAPG